MLAALLAFTSAWLVSFLVPVNRWLWTAPYTLYTIGWSILGFLLFAFAERFVRNSKLTLLFTVAGANSLLLYCLSESTSLRLRTLLEQLIALLTPIQFAIQVFTSLIVFALFWTLCALLYRKRIFLRA